MSSRTAWSTEGVPGQPKIHREPVSKSQKLKIKIKEKLKLKDMLLWRRGFAFVSTGNERLWIHSG